MTYVVDGHTIITDPVEAANKLANDNVIGLDLETTGFSAWRNRIATIQLYGDYTGTAFMYQTPDGEIPAPIKDLLHSGKVFVAHNAANFDMLFLHTHGIDLTK